MRNNKIYVPVLLMTVFSLSLFGKENVGMKKKPASSVAQKITADCRNTTAQFDLDINNVRARILNGGDLWWDPVGQTPYYEVPIGSNKNSIYSGALWIAGLDNNNQIKAACQTYRQSGANDFWSGPISKDPSNGLLDIAVSTCEQYDRFWTTTKAEVENFVATGEATTVIKEWPGNGNVALGQEPLLAPFIDIDNDGVYNYAVGDYPAYNLSGDYPVDPTLGTVCNEYLFGDKNVWWVFNDVGNSHTETFSNSPIGLEIRGQAFGFRTADDINNMTFYKYKIINRSNDVLNDTYFGVWCDPDLGNASDDYVGCDVGLGLGYCYNADPDDDGAGGYGLNPPAVGIDFFQGPLADVGDGLDNDKDGTIDEPGEQIIMSKFVYYKNVNSDPAGNPDLLDDYYQYLSGIWLDGQAITYGGNGRDPGTTCNYMFPELTDPAFTDLWTMASAGIPADDMRWLQSAGTFTLQPGAVNFITTGVVWAKATAGGPGASISLMKLADQKAQALFDNCFKVLDGPNAPDVAIRELDQQLILSLENTGTTKIEYYDEIDPTIPLAIPNAAGGFDTLSNDERSYKFQGYRVFQLASRNVSNQELGDPSKAKLIRQIDLKDNIVKIVNYAFNGDLGAWFPTQVADSNSTTNLGLTHHLMLTKDEFTGQNLINYRPYYYMVVSYGYNNFRPFDPSNGSFTQSSPYKQGRLNVKVYSGIPHKPVVNNGGMIINAFEGQGFVQRRIEGQGNGGNVLDFTDETVNEILTSPDHQSEHPVYQAGRGPVSVRVYDPVAVKQGSFALTFNGLTSDKRWFLNNQSRTQIIDSATFGLNIKNAQINPAYGIETDIQNDVAMEIGGGSPNNGFLEATLSDNSWLTWLADNESGANLNTIFDFIRAGSLDPNKIYENVLGGTWAPVKYCASDASVGLMPSLATPLVNFIKNEYLASINVVITPDKSKWTRCAIFEMGTTGTVGSAPRFAPRAQASVDKNGSATNLGGGADNSDYISATGMGWFPGYAVNLETGERLNMAFGENSALTGENSTDMLWNPTANIKNANGANVLGGMHYIWVFGHNLNGTGDVPKYDFGAQIISKLSGSPSVTTKRNIFKDLMWTAIPLARLNSNISDGIPKGDVTVRLRVARSYRTFVATGVADTVNNANPYYEFTIPGSAEISTGQTSLASSALDLIRVVPNPYYAYSSYERTREDQLDNRIRIVNLPSKCTVSIYTVNGTLIRQIKRDVSADVSTGLAVEEGRDDNISSTLDWDLKNSAGIPIASGVYYFHIDGGNLGEKVVKWLGVIRPIDLDTF